LIEICDSTPELQLPEVADTVIPLSSLSGGELITKGRLHHIALREILVEQSQWGKTFDNMLRSSLVNKQSLVVLFGSEKCVPPTAMPQVIGQVIYMTDQREAKQSPKTKLRSSEWPLRLLGPTIPMSSGI
jgi:hypothetical protein